jgi:hypothetical protein
MLKTEKRGWPNIGYWKSYNRKGINKVKDKAIPVTDRAGP